MSLCVGIREIFLGPEGDWGREHTPVHKEEWGSPQNEEWSLAVGVGGFFQIGEIFLYVELWGKSRLMVGWDLSGLAGIAPLIPQASLWERSEFSTLPWLVFSVFNGGRCCLGPQFEETWGPDPLTLEKCPLSNRLPVPVLFHMQQVLVQRWVQIKPDTNSARLTLSCLCVVLLPASLPGVTVVAQCLTSSAFGNKEDSNRFLLSLHNEKPGVGLT